MIKLTPDHVGTRVLLNDGRVGYIGEWIEEKNLYNVVVEPGWWEYFAPDSGSNQSARSITLFLDAPNPMDVEVPGWCEDVVVWYHDEAIQILDREQFQDWRRASHEQPPQGWSPAPCQMPPKNNEEYN